ncbi:MAG: valine--tRNA ligase [Patescibacteria group bacterium]|nr:valine--tRNA ligase [Patescibacteria group bacterium]
MEKIYKHQETEGKWYSFWEKKGFFRAKIDPKKEPFMIIMPPPNANGELHIGHALFVTLEDILIRFNRMLGRPTLWLPGADHAGIQTQVVYERLLEKQGKTRYDLGRDKFYSEVYDFTMKNKATMENQLSRLGASCDWSREKFTLDSEISKAVYHTFKKLFNEGLAYRGERLVNWCPRCTTALSDAEVAHKEKEATLWFIKYPLAEEKGKFIIVTTTRPETMLGDTAVAVNPTDRRYKNLIGCKAIVPLINREIPIIEDSVVDKKFGTGAVKVTPAHDPTDFEISERHDLKRVQVIGFDNRITDEGGKYAGLKVNEARRQILEDLKKESLLEKEVPHLHSVGRCERCNDVIEPLVSLQWFVKMPPLAKPAIEVVKEGKIKFIPKRYEKIYFQWMENLRDWCVSRQIWWGHQLPIWYCGSKGLSDLQMKLNNLPETPGCGEIIVSTEEPKQCPKCHNAKLVRDPDTFDTWFSSGQWPFTTLSWPEKTQDFQYFYPTSVMETGYEILFLWVSRMIMLGLYCTDKIPFRTVYLHGIVRDAKGQKMSKSKGNVINPLTIADQYGADAIRIALVFNSTPGNDLNLGEDKIRGMRNFTNKIWNIARFVIDFKPDFYDHKISTEKLKLEDKKILSELKKTKEKVTKSLENYRFSDAAQILYQFIWHQFADIYVEKSKDRREETQVILEEVLKVSMELLHPFMPYVTEEVWQRLPHEGKSIMVTPWPK